MSFGTLNANLLALLFIFLASVQSASGDISNQDADYLEVGEIASLSIYADPQEVRRGETVAVNVTLCNRGTEPMKDVFIDVDILGEVEEVIPTTSLWRFDELEGGVCANLSLAALVPRSERRFVMESFVSGEGFVNLSEDYSTAEEASIIECNVTAWAEGMDEPLRNSTVVTVIGGEGAELRIREMGIGNYSSHETASVDGGNGSIEVARNVSMACCLLNWSLREKRFGLTAPWFGVIDARNPLADNLSIRSQMDGYAMNRWYRAKLDDNETILISGEGRQA